jgi:hypothetical protein
MVLTIAGNYHALSGNGFHTTGNNLANQGAVSIQPGIIVLLGEWFPYSWE